MEENFYGVLELINTEPNIVNSLRNHDDKTFMILAGFNKQKRSVEFLSTQPHDISVVDDNGCNVLHYMVDGKDDDDAIEMLNYLDISQLNKNVINKQNCFMRETPLHIAAIGNLHKTISWLIDQGADFSLKDCCGLLPGEHRNSDEITKQIIRNYRKW